MVDVMNENLPKGTTVTVRTTNGGEITAILAANYRPTYAVYLEDRGHVFPILATRIRSIHKKLI